MFGVSVCDVGVMTQLPYVAGPARCVGRSFNMARRVGGGGGGGTSAVHDEGRPPTAQGKSKDGGTNLWSRPTPTGLAASLVVPLLVMLLWERQRAEALATKLTDVERRLSTYEALEPRAVNTDWQETIEAAKQRRLANETSSTFVDELFDTPSRRFPHGHDTSAWNEKLRGTTPRHFGEVGAEDEYIDEEQDSPGGPEICYQLSQVVISERELHPPSGGPLSAETRRRSLHALRECGFVYLDNIYPADRVHAFRKAYERFRATPEAKAFEYPCQGQGRREHMLPFARPFNESTIYSDPRLLTLLGDFLGDEFKMELMTVITSPPGSKNQRWHQGWRYLFHPDERLPPYAVVVALPLDDVTPEMGPTEMCPGKKRRFYYGWRCDSHALPRLGTTAGTLVIFDYKTLHRGLGNDHPMKERPMVSMVFSRHFFINAEAFVNRGISLAATLNLRRYWEQWFWHPDSREDQYAV